MSQRNKTLESHLVLVTKNYKSISSLFHLRPHSIHLDNRPVLLSSSPQLVFPSGPSSEPSFLPWLSAAAQLSRPLAEPGWLLSQLPNRWSEHGNISQRQPNDTPGRRSTADKSSYLRSLFINPVQPGLCLLHSEVPVLQRTCRWERVA